MTDVTLLPRKRQRNIPDEQSYELVTTSDPQRPLLRPHPPGVNFENQFL